MSDLRLVVVLCCILLATACGRFSVDEHVAAIGTSSLPAQVLVLSRLGDGRESPLLDSFHSALQAKLGSCGVETRLKVLDTMALNGNQQLAAAFRSFDPDAILLIRQTIKVNGSPVDGNFLFTLHSQREKRDLWKAYASLSRPDGSGRDFGAVAAAELVRTMTADGLLRNCPKQAA